MNSVNSHSITIEKLGTKVTIQRRTVLSDARFNALLPRIAPLLEAITAAVGEPSNEAVDIALTHYCRLVSQVTSADNLPVPLVTLADSPAEVQARCIGYLTETNPVLLEAWDEGLRSVDASWNAPELTPHPPENLPKNS